MTSYGRIPKVSELFDEASYYLYFAKPFIVVFSGIENWDVSSRGAGYVFGASIVSQVKKKAFVVRLRSGESTFTAEFVPFSSNVQTICFFQFNQVNDIDVIARAHQLVMDVRFVFPLRFVTRSLVVRFPVRVFAGGLINNLLLSGQHRTIAIGEQLLSAR